MCNVLRQWTLKTPCKQFSKAKKCCQHLEQKYFAIFEIYLFFFIVSPSKNSSICLHVLAFCLDGCRVITSSRVLRSKLYNADGVKQKNGVGRLSNTII